MTRCRTVLMLLLMSAAMFAQDFRATLTGTVTDPSGAAIPGATVRVINSGTGEIKEAQTTAEGHYAVPYLNPGTYNIEATSTGFQTTKRNNIVLRVADKVDIPVQLSVGQMSVAVEVTSTQDVLDTADASRGLVFDPIKTQQYPLNGRQEYMLMALTPGVLFTQEQFGNGGYSGTRGWDTSNAYTINGARSGTNVFLLNGAPISDNGGTWQIAPNVDAIQEFKVMTNTYDAQWGQFAGGAVNTTLRSGTNDFHGSVFDYFRNSYMDSNWFQNNYNHQAVPFHNQHQFGGSIAGPIRKNKDFFLFTFEGWREVLPAPSQQTVPTPGMKTGNFNGTGITIYDPMTSLSCSDPANNCAGHTYARSPFPGNIIPASRMSAAGQKILGYYPNPTSPGLSNNFNAPNVKDQYAYNQPIVKWDHDFDENNKMNFSFDFQHGSEYRDSSGFGGPASYGDINAQRTPQHYIFDYTRILSATSVFDVRMSFGRFTDNHPGWGDPSFKGSSLGVNIPCAPTVSTCAAPRIDVTNFASMFGNGNYQINWWSYNTWDLLPSLTLNRGTHTLHIGAEAKYVARPSQSSGYASGYMTFNNAWTRHYSDVDGGASDGSGIASMLLGDPASGQVDFNTTAYITRPYFSWYLQDDWKVSSKLTINGGIRYEVQMPWVERYNRGIYAFNYTEVNPYSNAVLANWNKLAATSNDPYGYPAAPSALLGGLEFLGANGNPTRQYHIDWTNLAPRLGFAYRVDDKTVLRAGVGVFYRPLSNNLSSQYGFSQTTNYTGSVTNGLYPMAGADPAGPGSLANPFPNGLIQPVGATQGLMTYAGNGISYNDPRYRTPRTYQYSFGLQRELPGHINLELSYAGNREIFVPVSLNWSNYPQSAAMQTLGQTNPDYLNRTVANPFYGILPTTASLGASATIARGALLRAYPLFTGMTQNYSQQVGYYNSHELQVKVEKRVLGGAKSGVLTWVLAYTFGKKTQADHRLDNWNLNEPLVYEMDDLNKTHEMAFSGVWDLPIGKGKGLLNSSNHIVNKVVSDWQVDWILTYSSGFPVGWPNLLNYCGNWNAANQNENSWFNNNKACYSTLSSYMLRQVPDRFATIFNPAVPQLNAAAQKTIALSERFKAALKLESFNATNTPLRPGPDTSFSSTTFGQLPKRQQNFPRTLQISAKITF